MSTSERQNRDDADSPSELFEWAKKLKEFRRFWRTPKAILANEPIYNYSKKDREGRGYLGPGSLTSFRARYQGCQESLSRLVHGS